MNGQMSDCQGFFPRRADSAPAVNRSRSALYASMSCASSEKETGSWFGYGTR